MAMRGVTLKLMLALICLTSGAAALAQDVFDTSRLPRTAGGKEIYASPAATIFVSPDGVAATAGALAKTLAGLGWQRYAAPFTSRSDDPAFALMSLKKGPQALSVYVAVAPAQNNATSVTYSSVALANDLPFPAGASDIEFDPNRPYLAASSQEAAATLLNFFREELITRGWSPWSMQDFSKTANADVATPGGGYAYYVRDTKQALLLQVTREGAGPAKIKIESQPYAAVTKKPAPVAAAAPPPVAAEKKPDAFDTLAADILKQATATALNAAKAPPPAAKTSAGPVTALAAMASSDAPIPLPADADEIEFDGDDGKLKFKSSSSVREIAEFFRAQLKPQGWAEQRSVINRDNMVVLELAKEKKKLRLTIMQMGASVNVSGEGSGLVAQGAANTADDSAQSGDAAVQALEAEDMSSGLPVPKDHTFSSGDRSPFRYGASATVAANIPSVLAFYRKELSARGWSEAADKAVVKKDSADLAFTAPDGPAALKISRTGGETTISLYVRQEAEARKSPLMPKPGQVTVLLGNIRETAAEVTINGKTTKVPAGAGAKGPDGPTLALPPGKYRVTLKGGKGDELVVGPDEIWGVMAGPGGVLAVQFY